MRGPHIVRRIGGADEQAAQRGVVDTRTKGEVTGAPNGAVINAIVMKAQKMSILSLLV